MEWVLVLLVLFAMSVAAAVVVVRRVVRELRARLGQANQELRRRAANASLTARAAQPGAVGEVARVRRELRASVENTRSVLLAGSASDESLREALALCEQLSGHAERLDGELNALVAGGERDRARIGARLPELKKRAERIRASAESLRDAARDRAQHDEGSDLDSLQRQIELEATALRHWSPAEGRRAGVPAPSEEPPGVAPAEERSGLAPGEERSGVAGGEERPGAARGDEQGERRG
ncbi:hypothetical protein SAMN06297387_11760 [Streptomyces zhaozhouensis]|uniref:Secreted protein n=1 Tax=Streptomyces zhaozhouensis TaxID=1300267 RepID=A0A286E0R2_9ACTN|nr:hypothetical protein [Streptomyces zhaozhouensis]SOD64494.1 hypothetical protein SAMN06297387_11760 [Streptomyces zhaozhouensis]